MPIISPQAWGCTVYTPLPTTKNINLPTSVGMYRTFLSIITPLWQSPHKRGDVPGQAWQKRRQPKISPQAWGCTDQTRKLSRCDENLPTSVGMYRRVW